MLPVEILISCSTGVLEQLQTTCTSLRHQGGLINSVTSSGMSEQAPWDPWNMLQQVSPLM